MKSWSFTALAAALCVAAAPVLAEGDAAKGEKTFKKCKACHMIVNGDDVIVKGGKVGPNLFGVIGRAAGSAEGYKFGKDMLAAGEAGLVWDEAQVAEYVKDPKKFLASYLDKSSVKTKMTFKLKKGGEDVAAYLASVAE
ncbi:MAG: c-type cytochrome [Paracoccaceae bacterium]